MDKLRDVLRVQGINSMGFGSVSKLIMKDRCLTVEAKAIYSYFCSYAGAGDTAFPSVKSIREDLGMGEERFYYHFLHLKAYGYIEVTERINPKTKKFTSNLYTLVSNPVPNPELLKQLEDKKKSKKGKTPKNTGLEDTKDINEEKEEKPYPENKGTAKKPYTDFPCTEIPCPENRGTNINNISFKNNISYKNNNYLFNNQSINQYIKHDRKIDEKEIIEFNMILNQCELEVAYPSGNYPNGDPIPQKALESFKNQRILI